MSLRLITVPEEMQPAVQYLAVGDDPDLEAQLVSKSHQTHILSNTPGDAKSRFGSLELIEARRSKGRTMHWLIGPDNDLAGIMWYGEKDFPLDAVELRLDEVPTETFGIRLYEGYVGRRLARPFMELSLRTLVHDKLARGEAVGGIWLVTDTANEAALAAYTKFGYAEVFRDADRVTMIMDTKTILTLCK